MNELWKWTDSLVQAEPVSFIGSDDLKEVRVEEDINNHLIYARFFYGDDHIGDLVINSFERKMFFVPIMDEVESCSIVADYIVESFENRFSIDGTGGIVVSDRESVVWKKECPYAGFYQAVQTFRNGYKIHEGVYFDDTERLFKFITNRLNKLLMEESLKQVEGLYPDKIKFHFEEKSYE